MSDHDMTEDELRAEVQKFIAAQGDPGDESDAYDNWHDGAILHTDEVRDTHPLDVEPPVEPETKVPPMPEQITPKDVIRLLKQNKDAITHIAAVVIDTDGQAHILSDTQPMMVKAFLAHALNANLMSLSLEGK